MNSFEELRNKKRLVRYVGSEFGTMYFQPDEVQGNEMIIRHLDSEFPIQLLPTYEQLYDNIINWIDTRPSISRYVFMPDLVEVGKDYIIRNFYVYDISIRDYFNQDEPVEPPIQFEEMRSALSEQLNNSQGKEGIIERIMRKSLLGRSGKTYFNCRMNQFIIVEPKISKTDLYEWKQESSYNPQV